jgi:diketogulonate reductase-like aldo/keto reductase
METDVNASAAQSLTLADGHTIPVLGLGVWQIPDGPACVDAVRWALEAGYRHIDTAQAYGNEESVGRGLRDSARVGRTPAQVLIRWCVQHDLVVLPKSTHRERIVENAQVFDFTLSEDDMAELDALDRTGGTDGARESSWW